MTGEHRPLALAGYERLPEDEMRARTRAFNALLQRRRSIRAFSAEPVPRDVIEDCLRTAGSAPRPNGTGDPPAARPDPEPSTLAHKLLAIGYPYTGAPDP